MGRKYNDFYDIEKSYKEEKKISLVKNIECELFDSLEKEKYDNILEILKNNIFSKITYQKLSHRLMYNWIRLENKKIEDILENIRDLIPEYDFSDIFNFYEYGDFFEEVEKLNKLFGMVNIKIPLNNIIKIYCENYGYNEKLFTDYIIYNR